MIIKPSDIKNYYGATGLELKTTRSLNNTQLIEYIQVNINSINQVLGYGRRRFYSI